jgi:dTDP-4-amino-4,6-dideoxygalactose transaminase
LFIIRTKKRDELASYLKAKQIGCEIYYPIPLHLQECFGEWGYKKGDFPESERAAQEALALPIYPELTEEMQSRVVDVITDFHNSNT